MLHAVVMAGGAGTRFWPASRVARPKQLLDLVGRRTMIQATVDRLEGLVPPQRILVVTNQALVEPIAQQLPELPRNALLGEPCKRDTAPCIGLAAHRLLRDDPQAVMLVMPADHVIRPRQAFQRAIRAAVELVTAQPQRLATFGIRPTYPAEIFGYLQRGEPLPEAGSPDMPPAFHVRRFCEKPQAEVARQFLQSGEYYWNSGIFVWRAATIVEQIQRWLPEMAARLQTIADHFGRADEQAVFRQQFESIQGISIDRGVMEHAPEVVVLEAPFEWDDLGSWQAMQRLRGSDAQGNTIDGRHVGLATEDCIIRSEGDHLIVTLGVRDLIIVHTPDATLVADRHREEQIRDVVRQIEQQGWKELL